MLRIRRAQPTDLDPIMAIEEVCFTTPWPRLAMATELDRGDNAIYLVAEVDGELIGYAGMWCVAHEAHIMNLAVAPHRRREGIGEALLLTLIQHALQAHSRQAYLECRPTNHAAIALYQKLGFETYGRRRHYYVDTGEDALLMRRRSLAGMDLESYWSEWEKSHGTRPIVG
ncbi:MAG: ribosomal protein S18-alanine N-acetyltransferase [Candidatus Zipacnadales bacterium]